MQSKTNATFKLTLKSDKLKLFNDIELEFHKLLGKPVNGDVITF